MGKKRRYIMVSDMTLDDLVRIKRKGGKVIKHHPFGLTPEEYGHVYTADGYRVILKEDPEEITRRLKAVKMKFTIKKRYIISIMKKLKGMRPHLSDDYKNPDRLAWRYAWNATIDLARTLDVFHMIPEDVLRLK